MNCATTNAFLVIGLYSLLSEPGFSGLVDLQDKSHPCKSEIQIKEIHLIDVYVRIHLWYSELVRKPHLLRFEKIKIGLGTTQCSTNPILLYVM